MTSSRTAPSAAPASASKEDETPRACPICGALPTKLAFPFETRWMGTRFLYRGCAACGTTFVDPLPTEEQLRAIYSWDNYHAHHYDAPVTPPGRYRRSLDFLAASAGGRKTLLDFGCGDGSYLRAAKDAGYESHGVEYEDTAIAAASARSGVPVSRLDDLEARGAKFQIVHMNDVLPHLTDPVATMRRLENVLTPDGVLFIEGPLENNASLVYFASTLVKRARRRLHLDRPAHIAPTMLMRLDRRGQVGFFAERLGYRVDRFEIYETGWPYRIEGRRPASVGERVKNAVGTLAVAAADLQPTETRRLGNRFLSILRPTHPA